MGLRVAFFVNPLAGLGAGTNQKGSDHLKLDDCKNSTSIPAAERFIDEVKTCKVTFITPEGCMGGDIFSKFSMSSVVLLPGPSEMSQRKDTADFITTVNSMKPDIVIFVGGDGTARDVAAVLDKEIPVMGIPAGVKMYSSVFALSIHHGAELLKNLADPGSIKTTRGDIVDIDEYDYRTGKLNLKVFGTVSIPVSQEIIGMGKAEYSIGDIDGIVDYVAENMDRGTSYIIGPGSTCKAISRHFGLFTNELGFDVLRSGRLVQEDADENDILKATENGRTVMIISPIGGQGFLIGRGNRQLTPRVIEHIGLDNLMVISTPEKIAGISKLYVDLEGFKGKWPKYMKVLTGYGNYKIMPVIS